MMISPSLAFNFCKLLFSLRFGQLTGNILIHSHIFQNNSPLICSADLENTLGLQTTTIKWGQNANMTNVVAIINIPQPWQTIYQL